MMERLTIRNSDGSVSQPMNLDWSAVLEKLATYEDFDEYMEGVCSMKLKVVLDEGAKMPSRAHATDAGLDIFSRECAIVEAKDSCTFDTGVHIEIPEGFVGFLKSKSGLNVKNGITGEGVIDAGYTGSIVVKLYNNSGYPYEIKTGDKITQLVILPIVTPELELVESLSESDRGSNGFGSSGR